jgi:hypothetical protein
MTHQLAYWMENAEMPAKLSAFKGPNGLLFGAGTTAGNGIEGWAPGALFIDSNGEAGSQVYINEGTKAAASFVHVSMDGLSDRYYLKWIAGANGKPGINADILNSSEAVRMLADRDFEVLGTNATTAEVTYNAEGGLKLTTKGDADPTQTIILPHLDTTQTAWASVTWGTDREVRWEAKIKTGSAITSTIIWAGLKLTNTNVTATDANQVFFRYQNGVNSGKWQAINSIGDSDTSTDTGITVAVDTEYHMKIIIASDRTAKFYLNGVLEDTSSALTDTTDFIPYIGIANSGASAAKHMYVHGQVISRVIA